MGDGRLRCEHEAGFVIIKPENSRDSIPLLCPMCAVPMLTAENAGAFRRHECCFLCELVWVETHRKKWDEGWRPDPKDVQEELKRRRLRAKAIKI